MMVSGEKEEKIWMEKVKVSVNLEKGTATVQRINRVELFQNPAKRFVIESDVGGFSALEKREDGHHIVNYLRSRDDTGNSMYRTEKLIEDRKITAKEARETIRETLKAKYEMQW